jgi:hypothetical protein
MARNPNYNDDVARKTQKRARLSREYVLPYFERFLDNYKHYFLRTIDEAIEGDSNAYPFYSNAMLPITYQIVETILPRMFSRLPNFMIKTEMQNDERDEIAMRELIKYQMSHPFLIDDPVFSRVTTALKEEFITGNAWGEVPWQYKIMEVDEWQPYSIQLGIDPSWDALDTILSYGLDPDWKLVKVKKKVIDAPVFHHRSIFHVLPDPKKMRVSDLSYAIIEDMMTMDQIMDMVNMAPSKFKNIEDLKKMKAQKDYGDTSTRNWDNELAGIFGSQDYSTKDDTEGQFKVSIMREPGYMCVVINEKLTIREGDNPNGDGKLGLFLMKDIPVPHQLYAWGEPDPIKKIEDGMTDQWNMRNDSVFYDLMRMWKLDPTALVDGEEFIPEPGNVVQMKDLNGLEPLETGTTKASAYREYDEWDKIIQNTSGVSDYITGGSDPSNTDTKGGIELFQQAANARFNHKLTLFEHLGLKAMGTQYVQRNMRFFDADQALNTDKGKMVVTPTQVRRLRGNVHFIVDAGSTEAVSRDTDLKKWGTIINAQGKVPFLNPSQKAQEAMRKGMLYALGETDVDELAEQEAPAPVAPAVTDPLLAAAGGQVTPTTPVQPSTPTQGGGTPSGQNPPAVQSNYAGQ